MQDIKQNTLYRDDYKCGVTETVEFFTKNKDLCKICNNERHMKYYYENKEQVLQRKKSTDKSTEENQLQKEKRNAFVSVVHSERKNYLHMRTKKHKTLMLRK